MAGEIRFNSKTPEYAWLSNFSPHPVEDRRGRIFPSAEHMYQAAKTTNEREQEWFLLPISTAEAKRLASKITLRPNWEGRRVEVMRRVLALKFHQHPDLKEALLATGDTRLVHEAPWDGFWGSGNDGYGRNWLGHLLEELREKLKL